MALLITIKLAHVYWNGMEKVTEKREREKAKKMHLAFESQEKMQTANFGCFSVDEKITEIPTKY